KKVDNTPSNTSSESLIKLEGNIKSNLDFYKVTLSWSKAEYSDKDIESLKYKVLVSTDSTFAPGAVDEFFKVVDKNSITFNDSDLIHDEVYYARVRAVSSKSTSIKSNWILS